MDGEKKVYYAIGNAHLDPVWQWRWTEGYAEAKATFRSALDRIKEFGDFVFTCSSASVYAYIEESAPEMFEEIKRRVAEGRWVIVGGWWVQPDCNLPSGEAYCRQSLYSQRYFKSRFGVTARVGYNVDSFGHNYMLPQILKKSGMDYYVFMRPGEHEKHLETDLFRWTSPDGSSVLAYRLGEPYCANFDTDEELERSLRRSEANHRPDRPERMFFYGVGNHGGGPTVKNIEALIRLRESGKAEVIFCGPDRFFEDVQKRYGSEIPAYTDDLQHHASGCYSAVSEIKALNRRCEMELLAAEVYSVLAAKLLGRDIPNDKLEQAWRNVLFNQFHDSLGGCSIREVYDDARIFAGEPLAIAAKLENAALQSISWAVDTMKFHTPIFVFNPHPWEVTQLVRVNHRYRGGVTAPDGRRIPAQYIRSSTEPCTGQPDLIFLATVPAYGFAVYDVHGSPDAEPEVEPPRASGNVLENAYLRFEFEPHTGYMRSMYDKIAGRELLSGMGAVPVVVDEFYHDTWSHGKNFFDKDIARFSDAEITVLENGPVRATLKVESRYNKSTLTQYFSLDYASRTLSVSAKVDWHEKHKMLKLRWPVAVKEPCAFYEVPFGWIERPCDGEEEPGQQWVAVRGKDFGMALLNDSKYSFSIKGCELNLTVVRSPIYGDHGNVRSPEAEFTDQGEHRFEYELMPVYPETGFGEITRRARQLNKKLTYIAENRHEGKIKEPHYSGVEIDAPNVIITAVKAAEDGRGMIVRAFESDGKAVTVRISCPLAGLFADVSFSPHEVRTLRVVDGEYKETLITELE
ncbi:MAG TPA: glycoside hydrolase family 38 C-terminal domain-containing protein [Bacillota bacterium]|nr:glycoside hydrolase family 38 C-terminal domain-containing protein [Bacillota bacterium]